MVTAERHAVFFAKSDASMKTRAPQPCDGQRLGAASAGWLSASGAGTNGATRAVAVHQSPSTLVEHRQEHPSLPPRRVPSVALRPRHAGSAVQSEHATARHSRPSSRRRHFACPQPLQRCGARRKPRVQPGKAELPEQQQRGWPRAKRQERPSKRSPPKSASDTLLHSVSMSVGSIGFIGVPL